MATSNSIGAVSFVHNKGHINECHEEQEKKIFECNVKHVENKSDLLRVVATALKFPDYFGMNWDALDECLVDLEWMPSSSGYVLIVHGLSTRRMFEQADLYGKFMSIWIEAAKIWRDEGVGFELVFIME